MKFFWIYLGTAIIIYLSVLFGGIYSRRFREFLNTAESELPAQLLIGNLLFSALWPILVPILIVLFSYMFLSDKIREKIKKQDEARASDFWMSTEAEDLDNVMHKLEKALERYSTTEEEKESEEVKEEIQEDERIGSRSEILDISDEV